MLLIQNSQLFDSLVRREQWIKNIQKFKFLFCHGAHLPKHNIKDRDIW